ESRFLYVVVSFSLFVLEIKFVSLNCSVNKHFNSVHLHFVLVNLVVRQGTNHLGAGSKLLNIELTFLIVLIHLKLLVLKGELLKLLLHLSQLLWSNTKTTFFTFFKELRRDGFLKAFSEFICSRPVLCLSNKITKIGRAHV